MQYGCCVSMLATTPGGSGAEWIRAVKQADYDYIELPVVQLTNLSEVDFERVLLDLHDANLPCLSMNNLVPADNKITGPQANHDGIFRFLDRAIPRIERMGARRLVFGSAGAKNIPEGFSWDVAFDQTAQFLRRLSGALPEGVVVAVEPICRQDANFINNAEEGARLVDAVGKNNIRMLLDSWHMKADGEDLDDLIRYGRYLEHLHFATDDTRTLPCYITDGMAAFLDRVKKIGYEGTFTFEAYSDDPNRDLAPAVAKVREFMQRS